MTPFYGFVGSIFFLLYVGLGVFLVWHVLSSLRRIAKGMEAVGETLRQIHANRT